VPSVVTKVSVDAQGRMVLPKWLRRELGADPGELALRRTPDGVLLTPLTPVGEVEESSDGAPLLRLGRPVSNEVVLAAIDDERAQRFSTPRHCSPPSSPNTSNTTSPGALGADSTCLLVQDTRALTQLPTENG
jgi:bifunctional DNA-binding transcriptional regulator/antitoxin component of YhaV-PrlF toxin-antitoxin module